MIIEGKEKHLVNASIYLKNAILELKAIPCICTEDNVLDCVRCALIDDIKNIRSDVNDEISELIK